MLCHAFVQRFTFETFADELRCLLPDDVTRGKSFLEITHSVLETQSTAALSDARINQNCVFLKERLWRQLQELKNFTRNVAALILQRNFRKWIAQHAFSKKRSAVIKLQSVYRGWRARFFYFFLLCIFNKNTYFRKHVAKRKKELIENIRKQKFSIQQQHQSLPPFTASVLYKKAKTSTVTKNENGSDRIEVIKTLF